MRPPENRTIRFVRLWWLAALAWREMRRRPLPEVVTDWSVGPSSSNQRSPREWAGSVDRILRIGPLRPRCIVRALVLYRVISESGVEPELIIGLSPEAHTKDAHAWVEVSGHDLGPWPGKGDMTPLVTFDRHGSR